MFESAAQALQVVAVMAVLLLFLGLTRLWIRLSFFQAQREVPRPPGQPREPLDIRTMGLKQDHA